jgi:hypothetical protein
VDVLPFATDEVLAIRQTVLLGGMSERAANVKLLLFGHCEELPVRISTPTGAATEAISIIGGGGPRQ